jgi:hypothetical protein
MNIFTSHFKNSFSAIFIIVTVLLTSKQLTAQQCGPYIAKEDTYEAKVHECGVNIKWYNEWTYKYGKELPKPLPKHETYEHPFMKRNFASAMHDDASSTDCSNLPGPGPENTRVQYFHSFQKGEGFSGMCPSYAFIDDTTIVTLSFGRASTTMLLLHVGEEIKILDTLQVPGRGSSALELAGKEARKAIFRNTSGGAYFYLSDRNNVYIPGANNNILRIKVTNRKFDRSQMKSINIQEQILAGSLVDTELATKDQLNVLTAIMPDSKGNIWFTSQFGIIGLIHRTERDDKSDCPKVYASFIGFYGAKEKASRIFGMDLKQFNDSISYQEGRSVSPKLRKIFMQKISQHKETREEIQNSFSIGQDGVYIVSNFALYKFRFNEETKIIELDPAWSNSLKNGDLFYNNDFSMKPGHLNNGSGTTPTLMGERFVAIGDNDTNQINMCIYDQKTGKLLFRHKVFEPGASACENSIVSYDNSYVMANTYGYVDPFKSNETAGGIARFDYIESKGTFEFNSEWPAAGHFDPKTATPKLSAGNGMIYVYNRSDSTINKHYDWQLTAIDFRTGFRVFSIQPYFEKKQFKDNIGFISKVFSLGVKNYDRKVFNNIWATYAFGPNNSIYIGGYRGFIRFSSK